MQCSLTLARRLPLSQSNRFFFSTFAASRIGFSQIRKLTQIFFTHLFARQVDPPRFVRTAASSSTGATLSVFVQSYSSLGHSSIMATSRFDLNRLARGQFVVASINAWYMVLPVTIAPILPKGEHLKYQSRSPPIQSHVGMSLRGQVVASANGRGATAGLRSVQEDECVIIYVESKLLWSDTSCARALSGCRRRFALLIRDERVIRRPDTGMRAKCVDCCRRSSLEDKFLLVGALSQRSRCRGFSAHGTTERLVASPFQRAYTSVGRQEGIR